MPLSKPMVHRVWWKVLINTVLRFAQSGKHSRWLVVTYIDDETGAVVRYGFRKVRFVDAS